MTDLTAGDSPQTDPCKDLLNRRVTVATLGDMIAKSDTSNGLVVGIIGPWGSGKTTVLNFIKQDLMQRHGEVQFVEFNPWMFSGSEQLMERFFSELADQVGRKSGKLKSVSNTINQYSKLLKPIKYLPAGGQYLDMGREVVEAVSGKFAGTQESLTAVRDELRKRLRKLDAPIVVAIDDIDRLDSKEIREIFRLVRLTGNFPRIVYLLAFDRERVEQALGEDDLPGRAYLEKIVQFGYDLPAPSREQFESVISQNLTKVINSHLPNGVDADLSGEHPRAVVRTIVRPLIRNLRDLNRLAFGLPIALRQKAHSIDVADLVALESVRVFRPELYRRVQSHPEVFTNEFPFFLASEAEKLQRVESLHCFIKAEAGDMKVAEAVLRHLFPNAHRLMGDINAPRGSNNDLLVAKRVAHLEVLRSFLEITPTPTLESLDATRNLIVESDTLVSLARSIEAQQPNEQISTIESLHLLRQRIQLFNETDTGMIVSILYNIAASRSDMIGGLTFNGFRGVIDSIAIDLIGRCKSSTSAEAVIESALGEIGSLSFRLSLVKAVTSPVHSLLEEDRTAYFRQRLFDEIINMPPESLSAEFYLVSILQWARQHAAHDESKGERLDELVQDPHVARKVFEYCVEADPNDTVLNMAQLLSVLGSTANVEIAVNVVKNLDLTENERRVANLIKAHLQKMESQDEARDDDKVGT